MVEAVKCTADLFILEQPWPLAARDPHGQPLLDAKVDRLPGDLVAGLQQSADLSADGALLRSACRASVHVDIPHKVEAQLSVRSDECLKVDRRHTASGYRRRPAARAV
jgi:hypothetical protein